MKKILIIIMAAMFGTSLGACNSTPTKEDNSRNEETVGDKTYIKQEGVEVIYLAGGCFWGLEKLMQSLPGVVEATSGYANGAGKDPTYNYVIKGKSGYKETVRVEYKPEIVSLDMILFTYFSAIDSTIENRQGNDVGTQYQSGVYYSNDKAKTIVERIANVERKRYNPFSVEIKPLLSFYDAEEYHQDYLDKNPGGYCHIGQEEFKLAESMIVDPGDYPIPTDEKIKEMLTKEQYNVTQKSGTDPAFNNEYWDNHEKGIYVDIVTGEPLFSSSEKFDSGTGWPSFSKGIDENALILISDRSLGMERTSVQSRAGNSHLGHVFYGESTSPKGVRFCMNSSALRFIPFSEMEVEGYGYLKDYVS